MPNMVTQLELAPDSTRLVARAFVPGSANFVGEASRLDRLVRRVVELTDDERRLALAEVRARSEPRFAEIETRWLEHVERATRYSSAAAEVENGELRLLLGAYLTQAYAYEAAALTNPCMVALGETGGATQRFVMSARAIGEGHISSVAFFTGSVDERGRVRLDARHPHTSNGERRDRSFTRAEIRSLLDSMGLVDVAAARLLDELGDQFTPIEVEAAISRLRDADIDGAGLTEAANRLHWLVTSNYEVTFDRGDPISEHLLSPAAPSESRGMEDARFVRFTRDDGSVGYFATYTAFDGNAILPQLIETKDFHHFRMSTLTGLASHHKGMALFPRRVGGEYVALTRHDHERMFLARTDDMTTWRNAELLIEPGSRWDAVQIGNCGSPIETDDGWLVLTHGVGPMRRYTLSALLLDLDQPEKVIARLATPLVEPRDDERRGYVPDVVYTCGAMRHGEWLVVPYGYADFGIRVAVTRLQDVLAAMV